MKTGMETIRGFERDLRTYALERLSSLKHLDIYNEYTDSANIIFNIRNVFSQDTAVYLNQFGICIRAGNHCAKIVPNVIGINNTCRITFAVYNTKEQVDNLVAALRKAENDVYNNIV